MNVDLPAPVTATGANNSTPAVSAVEKPPKSPAASKPPESPDLSLSSANQAPQQLSVNYQIAENGHKVYFQVIDENTGQVIRQVPPAGVLNGEEQLYALLKKQSETNGKT